MNPLVGLTEEVLLELSAMLLLLDEVPLQDVKNKMAQVSKAIVFFIFNY